MPEQSAANRVLGFVLRVPPDCPEKCQMCRVAAALTDFVDILRWEGDLDGDNGIAAAILSDETELRALRDEKRRREFPKQEV